MIERGLLPDFSPAALAETEAHRRAPPSAGRRRRPRPAGPSRGPRSTTTTRATSTSSRWPSRPPEGAVKLLVAIADVDAAGRARARAIDGHARANTTSVYTAAEIFPMLPERLSTDLTSLGEARDRLAIVVEMTVGADGAVAASDVYRALVRNHAKLAYDAVAAWLDGKGPAPPAVAARARARRAAPAPGRGWRRRMKDAAAPARRARPSRRSRRAPCSTATRSPTCGRTRRTAPRSSSRTS